MDEGKKWYESKTVWGGLVAVGGALAGMFGYAIDAALQGDIVNLLATLAGTVGGALAIYGRIKATKAVE